MAQINIYKDCSSETPEKTYTCRRVLLGIAHKFAGLVSEMEGKTYGEQIDKIGEIVKIVFPEITDEELAGIDSAELKIFFREVMAMAQGKLEEAQKN